MRKQWYLCQKNTTSIHFNIIVDTFIDVEFKTNSFYLSDKTGPLTAAYRLEIRPNVLDDNISL